MSPQASQSRSSVATPWASTPLDPSRSEFRLLWIAPPATDDDFEPVHATLTKDSLDATSCNYIALSYVWGDSMSSEPVTVNGNQVTVTTNLLDFLLRYRKMSKAAPNLPFTSKPVWVDAICIDQGNTQEKNNQVQKMGDLYRHADATLSWVGPYADDSHYFMSMISELQPKMTASILSDDRLSWAEPYEMELWRQQNPIATTGEFHVGNRFWDSARKFLKRPYWDRAWVVQELVLSKAVVIHCGQSVLPLWKLKNVFMWLHMGNESECPRFADAELWRMLMTTWGMSFMGWSALYRHINVSELYDSVGNATDTELPSLWAKLVSETRHSLATDPRDKLYCVLGLLNGRIAPRYELSSEEAFCDLAKYVALSQGRLSLLRLSGHGISCDRPQEPVHALFVPSWVPNWDVLSKFGWRMEFDGHDKAGGTPEEEQYRFSIDQGVLKAQGVLVDTISQSRRLESRGWAQFAREYVQSHAETAYHGGGISVLKALTRFCFRDQDPFSGSRLDGTVASGVMLRAGVTALVVLSQEPVSAGNPFGCTSNLKLYEQLVGPAEDPESAENLVAEEGKKLSQPSPTTSKRLSIASKTLTLAYEKAAFWTDKGYLGWGPPGAQKGDLVCVLYNCDVPVVLRKVDSHYIHVGACWVLGLMNGEAVEASDAGQAPRNIFNIV